VAYVDVATQLARLMRRDGLSEAQARARIDSQMSLDAKSRLADVVIDNSKDIADTRRQVLAAWQGLPDRAGTRG
jgi:dephospho-CoA kinase